jgi:squalene synthase HpnC
MVSSPARPPTPDAPAGLPELATVMARASTENFPVASRVLGAPARADLLAIYGFARLLDELGDSLAGDRLAALDWLEAELDLAFLGRARNPLLVRLQPTLRARQLPREPFARLIEANRVDQRVRRYDTWEQLRGYCALSADPVGELVLGVFGLATPERIALSDSICTALQLLEHCQDVAEDYAAGRIYMPGEDMRRYGCREGDLSATQASRPLRELIAFEVARARELLAAGAPLIGTLRGRPRIAIAAVLAGAITALDAIEVAHFDTLGATPRPGSARRLLALAGVLRGRRSAT